MQKTAIAIVKKLRSNGFEALFAGGCVRDLLLKKEPEDYDIATNAKPEEIEDLFEKTYPIGKHFGVILINENGHHFEIATFRSDGGYSDGRRPKYVTFTNAKEDALRRDFTINGIFYDPITKEFHDYVGGIQDLKRGLLRFIGNAEERIREDKLRILRAVRFKNRFNLEYGPNTKKALKLHESLILGVSAERIRDELNKIIIHKSKKQAFEDLIELDILEEIIPELLTLKKIPQDPDYHSEGDALTHSLLALEKISFCKKTDNYSLLITDYSLYQSKSNPGSKTSKNISEPGLSELLWATLLHDIGKAKTFKYANGRIQFHSHQDIAVDIARNILNRLKFPNASKKRILWLIHNHHLFDQFNTLKETRKLHYFDHPYFPDLLKLHHADLLASVPKNLKNRKKAEEQLYEIEAEYLLAQKEKHLPSHLPELLTGEEIMKLLNLPAGKKIGEIKAELRELQLEKKIKTKKDAREFIKQL